MLCLEAFSSVSFLFFKKFFLFVVVVVVSGQFQAYGIFDWKAVPAYYPPASFPNLICT